MNLENEYKILLSAFNCGDHKNVTDALRILANEMNIAPAFNLSTYIMFSQKSYCE